LREAVQRLVEADSLFTLMDTSIKADAQAS